ncbi:Required for respiratory growth protein 9 mitochondrial [Coemansia spiralis]|uniref:Required for respiratory growth protein 9, mitochondrial n=2 Tax=Coemansia TaxID=4863 RepID=A0A9W8GCH1_9FUNG|nr:hypothetical protein BX070DRAFT_228600 [Coemansia spiralis]KAJ1995995.1 Required for respiratory growth protein 9 mitochondrial [Coemansia umbellata]KAJ2625440.1 Required for respiratory growth protein 9 mitochondrial [Coemansia sp. RSA 1358]KAJ2680562.1 Required for respiratory growth protein 9 mitochondrial [Coemansia spiralis]
MLCCSSLRVQFRQKRSVVWPVQRANISTAPALRSIGRSVLYDISTDSPKVKSPLARKLASVLKQKEERAKEKDIRGSTDNKAKDSATKSNGNAPSDSLGFVKVRRNKATNSDRGEPVESLTQKAAEAKIKSEQNSEKLLDKLKDPSLDGWRRRKIELKLKLKGEHWNPTKKIASSSMEKIRLLNSEFPDVWTLNRLSKQFKVSQESVRRILKSKFQPPVEHIKEREIKRKAQIEEYKKTNTRSRQSKKK